MISLLMLVEPILARTSRQKSRSTSSRSTPNRSALSRSALSRSAPSRSTPSRSALSRSAPSRSISRQSLGSRSMSSVQRPSSVRPTRSPVSPRISTSNRPVSRPRIGKRPFTSRPPISNRSSTLFNRSNRGSRKVTPILPSQRRDRNQFPSRSSRPDFERLSRSRKPSGFYRHRSHQYYLNRSSQRRIFYPITWPSYYRPIYYSYGPYWTFGCHWPYYHRKYIFVSLGGYWPSYSYRRYCWYPSYSYRWYGDYPVEYVVPGDNYNYYYYGSPDQPIPAPSYGALNDARKKLEEKPLEEPAEVTQADRCFEEGVKTFEAGNYADAAAWFRNAFELAPNDIVLPFAYIQALFADGQYQKAAEVLCSVLSKVLPQEQGVFYPRGLYSDENVLKKQIEQLDRAVRLNPFDSDLQLLSGYQLLGMGRFDEALKPLKNAQKDHKNTQAATMLLDLLEKLKKVKEDKMN